MAKQTILIVEDEPDIAELIRLHLALEGFEAGVIPTGRLALEVTRKRPPDLLVLDLMLPGQDGFSVCAALRDAGVAPEHFTEVVRSRTDEAVAAWFRTTAGRTAAVARLGHQPGRGGRRPRTGVEGPRAPRRPRDVPETAGGGHRRRLPGGGPGVHERPRRAAHPARQRRIPLDG